MTTQGPDLLAYSRSPQGWGTAGKGTPARRSPIPPPYKAGTGREPGTWLAQKITTSRRAARPEPCPRCGTATLIGPDHDTCAVDARVDLEPVDLLGEVVARLTGRHTYALARGELCHRDDFTIHARRHTHPIHVEHRCPPRSEEALF